MDGKINIGQFRVDREGSGNEIRFIVTDMVMGERKTFRHLDGATTFIVEKMVEVDSSYPYV